MKLLRMGSPGNERPAAMVGETARDVSQLIADYDADVLADGGLARLREELAARGESLPAMQETRIGAPVPRPGKIVCVGLNYTDHADETGQAYPSEPILFAKAPGTVVGPYDELRLPPGSAKTDWEVELGVVIGQTARYLSDEEEAARSIAGYTISHDVSEREFQLERGGQWFKGKSCETFNPLGPMLVTSDEIEDPQGLRLRLLVNGEVRQDGNTKDMIFSVQHLVWYISQFMVLEPGDLINTGTPSGVGMGMSPPEFLRAGDQVELQIDGMGTQRQTVVSSDG